MIGGGGPQASGAAPEGRGWAATRSSRRQIGGCAGRTGGDTRGRRRRPRQGLPRSRARPARRRSRDGAGAHTEVTIELIQGVLLAFAIVVILMPPYIRMLRATGFTKQIRVEGLEAHFVKHGTPTMGGALIAVVVVLFCSCAVFPRPDQRAAGDARRRHPRRLRRLPQRQDRRGDPRPPEAHLAGRVRGRCRVPDPARLRDRPDRRSVLRSGLRRPGDLCRVRGVRDHRREQRREHHRRPRRARRRDLYLRVRRVPAGRAAEQTGRAAEPRLPLRSSSARCSASSGSTSTPPRSSWATRGRSPSGRRSRSSP